MREAGGAWLARLSGMANSRKKPARASSKTATKTAPKRARSTPKATPASHAKAGKTKHRRTRAPATSRSLWTGTLGFGLLQIPVSLHTATSPDEISFHQIDRRDHELVGYKRYNKATGEEVAWGDIVKGYEVAKGEYIVVTDDELRAANVEATQSIDIVDFVDSADIAPMYFETPYFVAPQKRAAKAYAVLRDALAKTGKAAIATVVIRTRQHVAAVVPRDEAMMLHILRYEHELRAPDSLELPKTSAKNVSERERAMAEELIAKMSTRWDPTRYHDSYREDVLDMIERKAKTGKVESIAAPKAAPSGNVVDLVAMLKKSLAAKPTDAAAKPTEGTTKTTRRPARTAKKGRAA